MVDVLVIPDGAAERPGSEPTALERARTPAIDRLCAMGAVRAVETTPAGLEPGSETGIPSLLGAPPAAQPGRGLIEAAAAGIDVPDGMRAWRCDLYRDGRRFRAADPAATAAALERSAPGCRAWHLRGHRYLLVGAREPDPRLPGLDVHLWGDGARIERACDERTVIVCAPGAAAGVGRLLGARVRIPAGATGAQDTDMVAKRDAALEEVQRAARGAGGPPAAAPGAASGGPPAAAPGGPPPPSLVVVHVGAPDEAAHELDADAKVAAIEQVDALIVAPLADAVLALGGRIRVSPDHGTDPQTGRHLADPVPSVVAGAGVLPEGPDRLVERLVVPGVAV